MIKDLIFISLFIAGGYYGYQKFKEIQAEESDEMTQQPAEKKIYTHEQRMQQQLDLFNKNNGNKQDTRALLEQMEAKNQPPQITTNQKKRAVLDQLQAKNQPKPHNADVDPTLCGKAKREMKSLKLPKDFNNKRAMNQYYNKRSKIQNNINKYCGVICKGSNCGNF
ncbi:MAG: hypothetical protein KDI92_08445 [Xanthomonadales bacterium]|nr:hypothetical protein [Xanthomonadales bacterium]